MPILGVLKGNGVPVKIWSALENVESEAMDQLKNVSSLPFVVNHVAVMADVHCGKGATIGSVIATQGAVIPSAVGVDIGCGMCAVKLKGLTADRFEGRLAELRHSIERSIPLGFNANRRIEKEVSDWEGWGSFSDLSPTVHKERRDAESKLCSLGGGNHFIEICADLDNNAWVMLHSGSRNIGLKLANLYINTAKELMKKMFITLPDRELAYLPQTDMSYGEYLHALDWAQRYAAENRRLMLKRILKDIFHIVGEPVELEMEVNCHHNFAAMENHFGHNVLVTRKGAVRARDGELGIIPGSMGTKSYIVRGKGNRESFESCSHGAGRRMSRSEAKRTFTKEDIEKQTAGLECRKDPGIIDELPGAYKDIDEVMANQTDLVDVVATLKAILCIKG